LSKKGNVAGELSEELDLGCTHRGTPAIACALRLARDDGLVDPICADPKEQDAFGGNDRGDTDRRAADEFRRFSDHSVGCDRGDLVGTEFCEQQVIRVPGPDDRRCGGRGENRDDQRGSDSGDLWCEGTRDPEIAVGPRSDGARSAHSGELGDHTIGSDAAEFVYCLLGEPHVSIGASRNVARKGIERGCWEFRESAGRELVTPDGMIGLVGKLDVAIGPGGDAHADPEKGELIFRDDSIRRDRSNFARRAFAEPDVAVWPRRDKCRIAQARSPGVADTAVRNDPGDFATVGKREPEAAIFAHRDRERLAASTDGDAFDRRRLGSNAGCREGERGESAGKLEMKLMPGEDEGGNGGLDEMKTCYHECNKFGTYLRMAKCNWLRRCNL
jgi:hypothetical protein